VDCGTVLSVWRFFQHDEEMKIKEEADNKRKEIAQKERQRKIEKGLISEDDPDDEQEEGNRARQ